MKEPLWRTCLCWSVVITFFTIPLIFFGLQVVSIEVPWLHFNEHVKEFGALRDYMHTIAALVFGLAGLQSWDKHLEEPKSKLTGPK